MTRLVSRRRVLIAGATYAGAGGAGIAFGSALAQGDSGSAPAKQVTKESAQYRDTPNGQQSCNACTNFQSPSACRVVSGTVSASGWCKLFQAKAQ